MARLTNLKVKEVTFTVKGANQPAVITLYKSAEPTQKMDAADVHVNQPMTNPNCRRCGQTVDHVDQFCKSCGAPFHKSEESVTDTATETVTETPAAPTETPVVEAPATETPAAETAPAAESAPETPAAEATPAVEAPAETEKSAESAPVVKAVETVEKAALDAALEKVAALEKALATETRLAKVAKVTDEITKSMKAIPGLKPAEFAPVLLSLREGSPAAAKTVESFLTAASKALESTVFAQTAQAGASASVEKSFDSAKDEYEALIEKKIADNPKLSYALAGAMVIEENKALYTRLMGESKTAR